MANLIEATAPKPEGIFPGEALSPLKQFSIQSVGTVNPLYIWFRVFPAGTRTIHEIARNCTNVLLRVFSWIVFIWLAAISLSKEHHRYPTAFVCALQALRFTRNEETLPACRCHGNRRRRCR